MSRTRLFQIGVSRSAAAPDHTRHMSCAAVGVIALLAIAGCETNHSGMTTAPSVSSLQDSSATADPNNGGRLGGPGSTPLSTTLGGPIAGLSGADLARFNAGMTGFLEVETVAEGLGPVFNEASCATCHNGPVGGTTGRAETRFGKWQNGQFNPLASLGGSLIQDHAIGLVRVGRERFTFVPETVPRDANQSTTRITTPLFGLGLVDAVSDNTLLALAQSEARNSPSTRGTPNMVTEIRTGQLRVGRFGWKAQVPTLHQFAGDAYLNEMGITNPEFPLENPPQGDLQALKFNPVPKLNDDGSGVTEFADFMSLLGPPPRGPRSSDSDQGAMVFQQIGCNNCHTPSLTTGSSPVMAVSHKTFQPYSDFLLHDMGELGDGIVQGQSKGKEMRTAPLWGLSSRPVFLHDGRASTPEDAILAHSGQGANARARFSQLDNRSKQALLAFLKTL